jgi:hypothetical protein
LNGTKANSFYVNPINTATIDSSYNILMYNNTTNEVIKSTIASSTFDKTFVIDHPVNENKYLVHACLEGPESGVYYRGKGEIMNNKSVIIYLPDYVDKLAIEFTVQVTRIYDGISIHPLNTSEVKNNCFTVYGVNSKFFWVVQGKRNDIEVEPLKINTNVKGSGPYKWI